MKRIALPLLLIMLMISSVNLLHAQINVPAQSPLSTVSQRIGLADVSIAYSRPSVKGRKIFGDLLPFDKIWRTGANQPTKITISDTVTIENNKLAPGEYAIYTIPGQSEWTIIFGKNSKTQVGDYKEGTEALKFKVKSQSNCAPVETFTIDFADLTINSANIQLSWENTVVKFKIFNEVDSKVMADIKQKTDNATTYFQSAAYYYETNRDLKQALEWANIAAEKDPKFYIIHLKAKIQAKLVDCKGAVETANKSLELAKAAKNDDYIKMNEKLIADCKGKK